MIRRAQERVDLQRIVRGRRKDGHFERAGFHRRRRPQITDGIERGESWIVGARQLSIGDDLVEGNVELVVLSVRCEIDQLIPVPAGIGVLVHDAL